MPIKTYLRHDQSISQRSSSSSKAVCIYAPTWVQEGLAILSKDLKNVEVQLLEKPSMKRGRNASAPTPTKVIESFKITDDFNSNSLIVLQKIARNEARNTNGIVDHSNYAPDIKDSKLINSIKDLARQCVIVGPDTTTFCGGYKSTRVQQKEPVYICDLAALQFQKPWNSGRLALLQEKDPHQGPLDDFIFERVVGEKRKSFKSIASSAADQEVKKRYIHHAGFSGKTKCYFDSYAYRKFVEADVLLSGLTLAHAAARGGDKLNFKFLKYGTGYFAGKFVKELNEFLLAGVVDGLEALFKREDINVSEVIRVIELPFHVPDPESLKRLDVLKKAYKFEYDFSKEDALKQTTKGKVLVTATTNCGDSNVAFGNAMGFKSVDGAIAENLTSKGNIFCPNLNTSMEYKYITM